MREAGAALLTRSTPGAAFLVITPARASSSLVVWSAALLAAGLIVLRSFVFLQYEQADFDADQAIVGLMATHLAEGRAWPLFFYGQLYMMGVQAWMAALVFLLTGPTVLALKLPLLLVNIVTAALLVWLLVREAGLRAWQALVASAWFTVLPPVTASRMVQAQGGTIEPLLYALLLWLLRARPVAFGLLFAFGFLHREFTLFGVAAILIVEVATGELFTRRRAAHWLLVVLVFTGARQGVTMLRHTASMFGPDAPPPRLADGVTNVDLVARSVCLAPAHFAGNVWWLATHNVPTFFGVQAQPAGALIHSRQPTGQPWAAVPLGAAVVILVGLALRGWRRWLPRLAPPPDPRGLLPLMLTCAGVLSLIGVATGCDVRHLITIRYHLMLALAPVGLTSLAFVSGRGGPRLRALMAFGIGVWSAAMVWSHVQLLHEYRTIPPPNAYRELADDLVAHGDRYGWASYWVSYHVNFLSQERVQLSPTSAIRISDYARQALRAGGDAVIVGSEPCGAGDASRKVGEWWVCRGR